MAFPSHSQLPLAGVRVLDASRILAGPFCGQILADLGADVVKLERPGTGDDTRGWGPPYAGPLSAYFLSCNRNKRSIAVDVTTDDGKRMLDQLLSKADVLIENYRTDSLPKLGLEPDKLLAQYPRLIVCSISGFGRTGPMKDEPGYDFAIQAMSGLMGITGPKDGPPSKVGVAVADVLTGLYASTSILACLHARQASDHGYAIDLALLDCALAAQVNLAQAYLTTGTVPARQGNAHLQIVPYQLFPTADGWIVLAVGNDSQWQSFCKAAGATELGADPRYLSNRERVERREEFVPKVEAIMRTRPTAEWERLLTDANVPHAAVADYAGVFATEQIAARAMKTSVTAPDGKPISLIGNPIKLTGAPTAVPVRPPLLGEHTAEVLKDWGIK
jgi:crotonobetainyl-CoA:carnitine CoA-transferase CaiB-like acyl-CoA transferase